MSRRIINDINMLYFNNYRLSTKKTVKMSEAYGWLRKGLYKIRQEAIKDITEYVEIFYNRQRKQVRLGFLSPAAFERWFYEKQLAA